MTGWAPSAPCRVVRKPLPEFRFHRSSCPRTNGIVFSAPVGRSGRGPINTTPIARAQLAQSRPAPKPLHFRISWEASMDVRSAQCWGVSILVSRASQLPRPLDWRHYGRLMRGRKKPAMGELDLRSDAWVFSFLLRAPAGATVMEGRFIGIDRGIVNADFVVIVEGVDRCDSSASLYIADQRLRAVRLGRRLRRKPEGGHYPGCG